MDYSLQVVLTRLLKFTSVLAYAAGVGVGLWGESMPLRKRAVHLFASPALVVIWLSGYVLTLQTRVTIAECWILGGFVCSLASHVLLTQAARREAPSRGLTVATLGVFVASLSFMVMRPTWGSLLP
jgi:hypothetical protein